MELWPMIRAGWYTTTCELTYKILDTCISLFVTILGFSISQPLTSPAIVVYTLMKALYKEIGTV